MTKIMPNNLKRGFEQYQEEFEQKALEVLRSGWYILGNEVKEFEILSNGTSGTKATATVAIPTAGTYTLVFADYEEATLNNMDFVTVTAESDNTVVTVPSEVDITLGKDDKIMLWQNITNLVPLCEAYIVK